MFIRAPNVGEVILIDSSEYEAGRIDIVRVTGVDHVGETFSFVPLAIYRIDPDFNVDGYHKDGGTGFCSFYRLT